SRLGACEMGAWGLDGDGVAVLDKVDKIAAGVVAPLAAETDRAARFPKPAIDALRQAGALGLATSKAAGGLGLGLGAAVACVERLARECPSTAMILTMHGCASAVIDALGDDALKRSVAKDGKLATLAFSEQGSRSHFWVAVGTATKAPGGVA